MSDAQPTPPACPPVPQRLKEAMESTPPLVVPFLGAGVSTALGFPGAIELIKRFRKFAEDDHVPESRQPDWVSVEQFLAAGDPDSAASAIRTAVGRDTYISWLRRLLSKWVPEPSQAHTLLNLLSFQFYLTTNYDRVLETTLYPPPEVFTYREFREAKWFMDHGERFVMKLHGDITRVFTLLHGTALAQSSGASATPPLQQPLPEEKLPEATWDSELREKFLFEVFTTRSVLFLGVSFTDKNEYDEIMLKAAVVATEESPMHYALVERTRATPELATKLSPLRIEILPYDPVKDHSEIWQFLAQLKSDDNFVPQHGKPQGAFFSTLRRPEYLNQQAALERRAGAFRFLTPRVTNALATKDFLEEDAAKTLPGFFQWLPADENPDEWRKKVIREMHHRRTILDMKLRQGYEVRILAEVDKTREQARTASDPMRARYRRIIELIKDRALDVELRLTDGVFSEHGVPSFGLALTRHATGSDVAVSYSTQANVNDFNVHIIQQNTEFARSRLLIFEQEWVRAYPENESLAILEELFA